MTDTSVSQFGSAFRLPRVLTDPATLGLTLFAGLVATIAFDGFGQWLSPALGYARLAPEPLATQTLQVVFGPFEGAPTAGKALHYFTGIVAYSLGYVLIALPIARRIVPGISGFLVATAYGVVLWAFALYVMAHLVAGLPPFLGFGQLTWVALIGHVLFAWVLAAVLAVRVR